MGLIDRIMQTKLFIKRKNLLCVSYFSTGYNINQY